MTPDLFWEPSIGDLVVLRPHARTGVTAEDDHLLRVRKATWIGDTCVYSCETTGPTTTRRLSTGRMVTETPCWTCFKTVDELMPEGG